MSRRPSHAKRKPIGKKVAVIALSAVIAAGLGTGIAAYGDRIAEAAQPVIAAIADRISPQASTENAGSGNASEDVNDTMRSENTADASDQDEQAVHTKQVAQYGDVPIYSPVPAAEVTGVLFHQASYAYALVMQTQLPQVDSESALEAQTLRVNNAQTDGTWLDADAVHVWRSSERNTMDTAVDIGAPAGTLEYAPVTGTVVLVAEYQLYNKCTDYEIHIQPDGHPELDFVVIHDEPIVAAGDHVTAGVTPMATVRDIAASITGIQLAEYNGTDGNHAHMQMNDADYEGYREKKLQGAIVPDSQSSTADNG